MTLSLKNYFHVLPFYKLPYAYISQNILSSKCSVWMENQKTNYIGVVIVKIIVYVFFSQTRRRKKGRLMWSQQDMSINSSHDWLPANDLSWLIRLPTSQDLISFLGCMQDISKGIVIHIKHFGKLIVLLLFHNNHENKLCVQRKKNIWNRWKEFSN